MTRLVQRLGLTRYEADEYYRQALELMSAKDPDLRRAILLMNDAISAVPNESEYYAARGLIYYLDGVDDRAAADFEKALSFHPYEMLAHYGLGMVAYRDSRWHEALGHFTNAYRVEPERVETLYYLALTYHHLGRDDYALQVMRQALERFPDGDKRKKDATRWMTYLEKRGRPPQTTVRVTRE